MQEMSERTETEDVSLVNDFYLTLKWQESNP